MRHAKRQLNKRFFLTALLLAGVALIGPCGASAQSGSPGGATKRAAKSSATAAGLTATATPPDYSTIGNALAGVTYLMRQDDVAVNISAYNDTFKTDQYYGSVSSITTANSNGTQNFDGVGLPICVQCTYTALYYTQDTPVVTGRFFHTVQDTTVSYPNQIDNRTVVDIMTGVRHDNGNASFSWNATQPLPYTTDDTTISQGYAADFNGDGYDELLMTYSDYTIRESWNQRMRIATANNVNDPSQGFNFGSEQTSGIPDSILGVTVADFNGDGQPDIAVLSEGVDHVLNVYVFSVDPQTLQISVQTQTTVDTLASDFSSPGQNQQIQIAAGNFTGRTNKQLWVASPSASNGDITLRIFDFAPGSYQPVVQQTSDTGATGITNMKLRTSKFAWNSPYDVISLMLTKVDSNHSWSYVYLYTVDPGSYVMTHSNTVDVAGTYGSGTKNYVALDIAVGNFNAQKPNPADPNQKLNDPNLQLAVAVAYAQGHQTNGKENFQYGRVAIVQVIDPNTGAMTLGPLGTIPVMQPGAQWSDTFQKLTIHPADLQGRSMRLGGGFKIKVEQTQPSMILTAPPMHVDYVTPITFNTPTVLNFSAAPDAFYSKYEQDTTTGTSYQHGDTTSSSFSGAETISNTTTFGQTSSTGELENGVQISTSFEAKQDLAQSKDQQYGEFNSTEVDLAQQTTMGDVLWFSDNTYYLYVFEVVGHTVCPGGQTSCDDSARVPLTMMFSTPTVSSTQHISALGQEWYQPLWEYGNILSYPGSYGQLQQQNPNLDTPLNNSNSYATDSSPATEKVTIVSGGTSSTTWQASQLFTETSDISVTGALDDGIPLPGGGSIGDSTTFGLNLSFGGSDGTSSLKVATTTSQATDTMTITKTAIFQNPQQYQYGLTPIIFGEQAPVGVDQDSQLGATYPDKVTYGPLRTGFTVDPVGQGGAFWGRNYRIADVGLNHPNRWLSTSTGAPGNANLPLNCVSLGTQVPGYMDCVKQNDRTPEDPWTDQFHDMRGFFITGAAHPGVGPQLSTAVAGDQLSLQARVYNDSFVPSQRVHVMFFAMKWDSEHNTPIQDPSSGKDSFFIGEDWLQSIPGFSTEPNAPLNSQLAHVTFDTTGYDDTNLVFWVAVWQEDANHNLIAEPTGKGFSTAPWSVTTINFADAAADEQMVNNPLATDSSDPAQTTFSNNLGLYRVPFYIHEKSAASVSTTHLTSSARSSGLEQTLQELKDLHDVSAVKVDVAKPSIRLGKGSEIFAILRNDNEAIDNLTIYFYDGDPTQGGQLFDSERVAHLRANQNHRVSVVYHPQQCGMHPIFLRITKGGFVGSTVSTETPLRVTCLAPDPRDQTPPTLQVTLTPDSLRPANGQMVPVTAQIEVSDPQDPRPDVRLESITDNEASDTSHDVAWAGVGTDDRSFLLRAASTTDKPEGRVYKVVYSATDWAGNKTRAEAYVTVPPHQPTTATAKRP